MIELKIIVITLSCCISLLDATFVDLTHVTDNETLYASAYFPFQMDIMHRGFAPDGDQIAWVEFNKIYTPEHMSTHMDAPAQLSDGPGKWRIDDIPIDRLISEAVVIDISYTADVETNPDATVLVEDLLAWEDQYGQIKDGSILFSYSGWDEYWGDMERYMGNANNDPANYHWPGWSLEAAEWIRDNRNIYGIGSDTMGFDPGNATHTHVTLLSTNVFGLENVKNLGDIPPAGARVYVFPMRFRDSSGTPCRIVAEFDTDYSAKALQHVYSDATIPATAIYVLALAMIVCLFNNLNVMNVY